MKRMNRKKRLSLADWPLKSDKDRDEWLNDKPIASRPPKHFDTDWDKALKELPRP